MEFGQSVRDTGNEENMSHMTVYAGINSTRVVSAK